MPTGYTADVANAGIPEAELPRAMAAQSGSSAAID